MQNWVVEKWAWQMKVNKINFNAANGS